MAHELDKLKETVHNGPQGAIIGGVVGYLVCKNLGYDKTISVISFTMVGIILGASIGYKIKTKLNG